MQRFCTILFVQYSRGLNCYGNIDELACFGKGRGSTETPSKLGANHNALGQLTNPQHILFFSEGGPSSNPELIEPFVSGWGERYCNNVNYVKNNVIFQTTKHESHVLVHPPKQHQDFVKEHNRTPLGNTCCIFLVDSWSDSQNHCKVRGSCEIM